MPTSSENTLQVSVVVCTRNSRQRIGETLLSLCHQTLPRDRYEVVVVDNDSNDGTAEWLEGEANRLGCRFFSEKELGLSAARNRGIRESTGALIFFIDDDAVAPAHLLETLWNDMKEHAADAVGGAVHGLWEHTPPGWLRSEYWRGLSLISHGPKPRKLKYPEILIGCNMGFRRDVFDRFGLFDPNFGRKGDSLVGNEERDLEKRLMEAGGTVFYNPHAYVFHKVPLDRMTDSYFFRRNREGAISNAMMEERDGRAERFRNEALPKRLVRPYYNQGKLLMRALYRTLRAALGVWRVESLTWKAANDGRKQVRKQNRR